MTSTSRNLITLIFPLNFLSPPPGDLPSLVTDLSSSLLLYHSTMLLKRISRLSHYVNSTFMSLAQAPSSPYQVSTHSPHIVLCVFAELNYSMLCYCSSIILMCNLSTWSAIHYHLACYLCLCHKSQFKGYLLQDIIPLPQTQTNYLKPFIPTTNTWGWNEKLYLTYFFKNRLHLHCKISIDVS